MGGSGRSRSRLVVATLGVVGALVFAGCDWPMIGFDAVHTGFGSDEAIDSANVNTLQPLFTVPAQPSTSDLGYFGSPVVSNGVVYAGVEMPIQILVTRALAAWKRSTPTAPPAARGRPTNAARCGLLP